ncbi:CHAD domain-containing protein [Roseivivax halotolerans]|uniref:CHAD domain-containing protein n=1 Tax=Roseivivax halotolerans TaxID=93684 RepID=A0A1I6A9X0_9RHOB|nr:CHAD domain-containing protein [Roseivivax halotolerans]SFQ65546.1 CHAD domain-containing protein [Roseivivax halotolerans]
MTSHISYWIAGDPRPAFKTARFGKDRLVPLQEAAETPAILHDTFDGQVASAGCMLLSEGDELILLGIVKPIRQTGSAPGFVSDMESGPVRDALAGFVSSLRRLSPLGEVVIVRQPMALLDDLDKTLARGDLTVLTAKEGGSAAYLSATPLRGYDKALGRLSSGLAEIRVSGLLDARGAVSTLLPAALRQDLKPEIEMTAGTTAFRAATDIIDAQLDLARAHEPGTIADVDSEFLHQYRVALRKVRSVLSLFKGVYAPEETADLKARFGALMAQTGTLRDLDVYLIERESYLALVPEPLRPGLELLFEDIAADRAKAQEALARHLESDDYSREMRRLQKRFAKDGKKLAKGPEAERKARDLARQLIWKRYRKVCKIAGSIDASTPDAQVHELRIHCKKLRYLMEFFTPIFPEAEIKPLLKALKRLQDVLGTFNDCAVQKDALAGRLEAGDGRRSARKLEIAKSLGALLTVLDQRQRSARSEVEARFAAFNSPATRAGFAKLFKSAGAKP